MRVRDEKIRALTDHLLAQGNTFAAYSLPNDSNTFHVIQESTTQGKITFSNCGNAFYIHPFSTKNQSPVFIHADHFVENGKIDLSQITKQKTSNQLFVEQDETDREKHLSNVRTVVDKIAKTEVEKVVLSRIKKVKRENISIGELFSEFCDQHPDAFVFLFSNPQSGIWLGVSPELFLKKTENGACVSSLAGTIAYELPDEFWTDKEREEQALVTSYIASKLKELSLDFKNTSPYSSKAGKVKHLRTDFEVSGRFDMQEFIDKMHPTPAVAGLPKEKAIEMIGDLEPHDREYYTGFLGPINKAEVNFYVNLRSMKVTNEWYYLFLGGGITSESDPEKEWDETELKAQTLLAVIENLQTFG